jgi:hypothetical protein
MLPPLLFVLLAVGGRWVVGSLGRRWVVGFVSDVAF